MRTNNVQKTNELKSILQQIINMSTTAETYVIKSQPTKSGTLKVEALLKNKEDEVIWEVKGTYFEVFCAAKLILYPLLK